jgi:hypothetical protein
VYCLGIAQAASPGGPGVVVAARAAFDTAMHHSLLAGAGAGAGVAVLGAVVGWRFVGTGATAVSDETATQVAGTAVPVGAEAVLATR